MLTSATRGAPRARALNVSRAAALPCATCQQRAFRFGPWGSKDSDSSSSKEAGKNQRDFRYRYMESVQGKTWGEQPKSESTKDALSKATSQLKKSMQTSDTPIKGGDFIDVGHASKADPEALNKSKDSRLQTDAERETVGQLFDTPGHGKYQHDLWKAPLKDIRDSVHAQGAPEQTTPKDVLEATVGEEQIDPITNRRISKDAKQTSASTVHASTFTPKFEDVDQQPNLQKSTSTAAAGRTTKKSKSVPKEHQQYSDLDQYGTPALDNPNAAPRLTPEELSKQYADLHKYKSVQWNEPDGLPRATPEELSKRYPDLDQYNAVRWNEPDGLREPTPEELSKSYQDLGEYNAVRWNEPDGLRELTPEEKSKNYSDLTSYDGPRTAKKSVLDEYEAIMMDTTVKGTPLAPKVEVAAEAPGKDYADLGEYKAVYWNEPDGLRKLTPEELSKQYTDLHLYGQVQWNEPDGLPLPTKEELSKGYQDLGNYGAVRWNEPDGLMKVTSEEKSKNYTDLGSYGTPVIDPIDSAFHVHPEEASKNYKDLASYQFSDKEDLENLERIRPEQFSKGYADLSKYDLQNPDVQTRAHSFPPGTQSKNCKNLGSYVQRSKPQGIASRGTGGSSQGNDDGHNGGKDKDFETLTPGQVRAGVQQRAAVHSKQGHSEKVKPSYREQWKPVTRGGQSSSLEKKQGKSPKLTGNYARDFPEEFTTSWSTTNSPSKTTLFPKDKAEKILEHQNEMRAEAELSSMDESFPSESIKLEPALNRHARRRNSEGKNTLTKSDTYSQEPQGLQTSYDQEAGAIQARPGMVKHYSSRHAEGEESQECAPGIGSENAVTYKILAYDAATDSVRSAETTSTVQDSATPLTPGDVIPKLSNPAKFFTHFSGLRARGFEIVSGERDVLVFRKIRSLTPDSKKTSRSSEPSRVNPIDMMGKTPVTGNFASPTGFVNYDSVEEEKVKPEPPFRSNIDVRKEEPVYSGGQQTDVGTRKKKGLGKKMVIGTAWVAGGAYAVGVLGEYYATRGSPPRPGMASEPRRA